MRARILANSRGRRSPLLGTSALISPASIRSLGPDEPRQPRQSDGGGGLFGTGIGPDVSVGDVAGGAFKFAFEDLPAIGLDTALNLAQTAVNPAGITGIKVPGASAGRDVPLEGDFFHRLWRGQAERARRIQDEELGQELFTAPLLGRVTPAGIGRVAFDPLNKLPLPIGLVGRTVGRGATRVGINTPLGQAVDIAREGLESVTIGGSAVRQSAAGVARRARRKVVDIGTIEVAEIARRPAILIARNLDDLIRQQSVRTGASRLLPSQTPTVRERAASTLNRFRSIRSGNPDEVTAILGETDRALNELETFAARAQTHSQLLLERAKFNIKRDGTLKIGGEDFVNFGDLVERQDLVRGSLTRAQQDAIDVMDGYITSADNFLRSQGTTKRGFIQPEFGTFFPRRVTGKDGTLKIGGEHISRSGVFESASASSRARVFEYAADALKAGFTLENDPVAVLGTYIRGTIHEGIDDAVTRFVQELPQAVAGRSGKFGVSNIRGVDLPDEIAKKLAQGLSDDVGGSGWLPRSINMLSRVNRILVPLNTTLDLSSAMIQGGTTLFSHPAAWMRAMGLATASTFSDPGAYTRFLQHNRALHDRMQAAGVILTNEHQASEFFFRPPAILRKVGEADNPLGAAIRKSLVTKPFKFANLHFSRFGNGLRTELWKGVEDATLATGKQYTEKQTRELAQVVNNMTGVGTKGIFGKGDSAVFFAPRFFRAQLDLVGTAMTNGDIAGNLARENISRFFVLGSMTTKFINDAAGEETVFDPTDSNFMRIRAFGKDVSVFGTYDTLFRALANAADGNFAEAGKRFIRGKSSPAVSRMFDVMQGESFTGKALKFDTLDNVISSLETLGKTMLPISVQSGWETVDEGGNLAQIGAGIGIETLGVKSAPLSFGDKLNVARDQAAIAVSNGEVRDYEALVQRVGAGRAREITKNHGSVATLLEERAQKNLEVAAEGNTNFEEYFAQLEDIQSRSHDAELRLAQAVEEGQITPTDFRKLLTRADQDKSAQIDQLSRQFQPVVDSFGQSESPVDDATGQYFQLFEQARTEVGEVDFGVFNVLLENFRRKIGEDLYQRVQGNLGRKRETALGEELRTARELLSPFFSAREELFLKLKQSDPQLAQFQSLDQLETQLRIAALEIDPQNPDRVQRRLRNRIRALRRIDSLTRRYKAQMKRSDPKIAVALERFYG